MAQDVNKRNGGGGEENIGCFGNPIVISDSILCNIIYGIIE